MPAQWPIFISNVSNKMLSRTSTGPNDFGMFVANEYFRAIKTAQIPNGNIHSPGDKKILEVGFTLAFDTLYKSTEPRLEDKFENSIYADMFEPFPKIDLNLDPLCDMEKWTLENKNKIEPFLFYQLFPSTCPNPNIVEETNLFGEIGVTSNNDTDNMKVPSEVTLKVTGGDGVAPYEITYRLNGVRLKTTTDLQGVSKVRIPVIPGKYRYIFDSAIDSTGTIELKDVNQSLTIVIMPDGVPGDIVIKSNAKRQIVPEMNEGTRVIAVAKRVLGQNDGTIEFRRWVENIDINKPDTFISKVKDQVILWMDNGTTFRENLNSRIFQEESKTYPDRIPAWLTIPFITTLVYTQQNKYLSLNEYKRDNLLDPTGLLYGQYLRRKDSEASNTKKIQYIVERDRFDSLKRQWVNETADANRTQADGCNGNDAYCIMADTIIKYWISTSTQPFNPAPPILPCNIPSPGTFIPISYGNKQRLADDLRRAWNTGKQFKTDPSLETAVKAVATAVAVSCSKHLKDLKFIYNGQLSAGTSVTPMIGFSPFTF